MTGIIRTVLGDRPASDFTAVAVHEHLLFDLNLPASRHEPGAPITMANRWQHDYRSDENPANARQADPGIAADALRGFAADGGDLLVEQSVAGIGRDPAGLAEASRASGVAVVAAAGTYTAPYLDQGTCQDDEAALTGRFIEEVTDGIRPTKVRAGIIGEIGCSWPLAPVERHALRAAAQAQTVTGAGISVHPGRDPRAPFEIVDILGEAGADLSRCVICHMDRTYPAGDGPAELAALGVCVEWDFFGIETAHYWMDDTVALPTDRDRLRMIRALFDEGHGARILISQDICTKTRLAAFGGHGYGHILRNMVPLMRRLGFTAPEIAALTRDNPLRLLAMPTEGTA